MHFNANEIYHVFNRGNNKQAIFFNSNNYIFFLHKIKKEWKQYCEILCYCLMPNHFHFMIVPNKQGCDNIILGDKLSNMQNLSKVIGKTLSSYTKAINIQNKTTGNLFQKKTQSKCLSNTETNDIRLFTADVALTCFHYIHQNPVKANLVKDLSKWIYSSFPDYYGNRNGTLCNKKIAIELLSLSEKDFTNYEGPILNEQFIQKIF